MCAQRFWQPVQAFGRGILCNRSDVLQHGIKAYNYQNLSSCNDRQIVQQPFNYGHELLSVTEKFSRLSHGSFSKSLTHTFHTGTIKYVKEFADNENEFAHSVLCSLPAYNGTVLSRDDINRVLNCTDSEEVTFSMETDWSVVPALDLANAFFSLSKMCQFQSVSMEDGHYAEFFLALTKSVPTFSDETLINVLLHLSVWPPICNANSPNFRRLWTALDRACVFRMKQWHVEKILFVADHWYALKLSKISYYNSMLTKLLGLNVATLSPHQVVQYLFYSNLSRSLQPFHVLRLVEKRVMEILNHLTIEELGVVSLGFFKTQSFLKNRTLVENILERTIAEVNVISDWSLSAILKILKKSTPVGLWKTLYLLLDKLVPQVPRRTTMCLLHMSLVGNELLLFHQDLINEIAFAFSKTMSTLRIKDIERIAFVLMLYYYIPPKCPDIFTLITNELRKPERIPEINHFPKCFISSVVYLVTLGIFPVDLISASLQPSMIKLLELNDQYNNIAREVIQLDYTLELEGSQVCDYTGHRLNSEERKKILQRYMCPIPHPKKPDLTHQEQLLLDVKEMLSIAFGSSQYVDIFPILPHFQTPDIVFCTNSDGIPQPLPENFFSQPDTDFKRPVCTHSLLWNALLVCGRNTFIRGSDTLRGTFYMKQRQLEKLGYHVTLVSYRNMAKQTLSLKMSNLQSSLQDTSTLRDFSNFKAPQFSDPMQAQSL